MTLRAAAGSRSTGGPPEHLSVTDESDGTTIIGGRVVDQAALHGLLQKVRDLGPAAARPFRWTKTADQIIDRICRYCSRISGPGQ
jgi:hypothetical protein